MKNLYFHHWKNNCNANLALVFALKYSGVLQDVKVYNNFIYNAGEGISIWDQCEDSDFSDSLIANNTIVNTRTGTVGNACIGIGLFMYCSRTATDTIFANNIVKQDYGTVAYLHESITGVTFFNNNWSRSVSGIFSDDADIVDEPELQLGTGTPDSDWLMLTGSSPCINEAYSLGDVTTDFFNNARGQNPDIGAHEYAGGSPTPTPTPTPVNLISNPGFESGSTGWEMWTGSSVIGSNAHSGSNCARIGADSGCTQIITNGVSGSTEYYFEAWGKVSNGQSGWISVDCLNSSDQTIQQNSLPVINSTSYTSRTLTFTAPAGTAKINVSTWGGGNYFYVDDFILRQN